MVYTGGYSRPYTSGYISSSRPTGRRYSWAGTYSQLTDAYTPKDSVDPYAHLTNYYNVPLNVKHRSRVLADSSIVASPPATYSKLAESYMSPQVPYRRALVDSSYSPSPMQTYKRMVYRYEDEMDNYERRFPKDDAYVEKMQAILSAYPIIGVPREPTAVTGGVYVGSTANAENIPLLKKLGIKYILNCAGIGYRDNRIQKYYTPTSGVQGYEELRIDDHETGNITSHFERAHMFIDYARSNNGKVLVHCPGVSRSGAIAISYLVRNGTPLLEATQVLKQQRRCALTNEGFMRQLVTYARHHGRLESNPERTTAPKYYSKINEHRIVTAHLPLQV